MNTLRRAVEEYLQLRRELGFKLHCEGYALKSFLALCEPRTRRHRDHRPARRWAALTHGSSARAAWRLQVVRDFAIHHHASDPRTEIPSKDLLPHRYRRKPPYLFSDRAVSQLLRAARQLPPGTGLRPQTYATLFGLLASTGLRVGEALALDDDHIDWQVGVLSVRGSKFGKSRLVPVHASTRDRLRQYQQARDRIHPTALVPAFFVSERGQRLPYGTVRNVFRRLCEQLRLRDPASGRKPRPRPPASLCREHPYPLVSRGCRCRTPPSRAEYVSGTRVLCAHLLVPVRGSGVTPVGGRASGTGGES